MYHLQIKIDTHIKCQCGGYYSPFIDEEKEKFLRRPTYRCDKCKHIIELELGERLDQKDEFGLNRKVFSVIPYVEKEM